MRKEYLPYIGPCILLLSFGYAVGRTTSLQRSAAQTAIQLVENSTPSIVPTVQIHGIRNGKIEGKLLGETRLIIGENTVTADESKHFAVDANTILTNIITVDVPAGMQYVASVKGSKYYPVTSAGGERIALKNRMYFKTAADAEAAGYKK